MKIRFFFASEKALVLRASLAGRQRKRLAMAAANPGSACDTAIVIILLPAGSHRDQCV